MVLLAMFAVGPLLFASCWCDVRERRVKEQGLGRVVYRSEDLSEVL